MRSRSYWYLFLAQTISTLGDYFGWFALQWFVYKLTGSLLAMGLMALTSSIPEFVIRLFGSPLIDRLNKLRLMAFLDIIRFFALLAPVLLQSFGVLQIWHLYVVNAVIGGCTALFNPATLAVIPSLINKEKYVQGYSLMDTVMYASSIIGPALAGIFITIVGATWGLLINSICFIISSLFIWRLSEGIKEDEKPETAPMTFNTYFHEIKDGILFFKYAPGLLLVMCFVAIKNMCSVAVATMMVPFGINILNLSAAKIGTLSSATAAGLLISSLLIARLGDIKTRRVPMLGSILVQGLLYVCLGLSRSYLIALVIYFFLGACGPFFGVFSSSIYAQLVPNELRGRVMSARLLVGGSLQPLGNYLGGFISQQYGIPLLFIIAGIIPMLTAIMSITLPVLKGIDGDLDEIKVEHFDSLEAA